MKPFAAIAVLALYCPALLEDTDIYPDPVTWTSGQNLPCEIIFTHADGTVDVRFQGTDGKWHVRYRQPVNEPPFDGAGSSVIVRER